MLRGRVFGLKESAEEKEGDNLGKVEKAILMHM